MGNLFYGPFRVYALLSLASGLDQVPHAERVLPNDPLFPLQYSFYNPSTTQVRFPATRAGRQVVELAAQPDLDLGITKAWTLTTGSRSTIVAVLDDGFFYQHEDIRDNVWRNPGETGTDATGRPKQTNGIDDDGNGFVDDVVGWDFAFDDPDPDAYVFDGMDRDRIQPFWHGISALGIIGARGNNGIGVAGINWDTSMMLLKIGAQGTRRGEIDPQRKVRAARAIRYAVDNGARVINWSGFVGDKSLSDLRQLKDAFDYAEQRGVLIVLAAGNSSVDLDLPANVGYPEAFTNRNLIRVAEINFEGDLDRNSGRDRISGSNFGRRSVEIAAIARNYTTTVRNGLSAYDLAGGTSSSAPVVTGVAALVFSVRPDLTAEQVKQILLDSARRLPALKGKLVAEGVIDAYAAVTAALRFDRQAR
ncbi:MAG: S8 family serine peptidase [Candidatus Solibacter usitatus]|nr:S8 family serine peptidase [Candidatus Solibacter usitatus]